MFQSILLYLALRRFRESSGAEIDISHLIPRFLKKGKSGNDYQYKSVIVYGKEDGRGSSETAFYFDAPYQIILYTQKDGISIPIACASFDRSARRTVLIKQIQGPSYPKPEHKEILVGSLSEIKWERLLVQIVGEWAKRNKLKSVEIISCKKSRWYREFRHEQMFVRYDVTARRMGFDFLGKEEVYRKLLTNRDCQ